MDKMAGAKIHVRGGRGIVEIEVRRAGIRAVIPVAPDIGSTAPCIPMDGGWPPPNLRYCGM